MPRVSAEQLERLNDFLDTLPDDARSKCALCNETLTHIVKQAEATTGAGTATVTRELAGRINDGAAPGDLVTGNQLRNRVQYNEGKVKCGNSANKLEDEPWPMCENCGENEADFDGNRPKFWGPKKTFGKYLCYECEVKAKKDKKAALEAYTKKHDAKWEQENPIDKKAEQYWTKLINNLAEELILAPIERITKKTHENLYELYLALEEMYFEMEEMVEPPSVYESDLSMEEE